MVGSMRWVRELPGVTLAAVGGGVWVGTTGVWGLGWGAVGSEGSARDPAGFTAELFFTSRV